MYLSTRVGALGRGLLCYTDGFTCYPICFLCEKFIFAIMIGFHRIPMILPNMWNERKLYSMIILRFRYPKSIVYNVFGDNICQVSATEHELLLYKEAGGFCHQSIRVAR